MRTIYSRSVRHVRPRSFCASMAAVGVAMLYLAAPVSASAPITSYSTLPSITQAGGHPDVEIYFSVKNRIIQASQNPCDCQDAKDSTIQFPPGFVGNPHATPQCSTAEFALNTCPIDSQVGIVNVGVTSPTGGDNNFDSAVYNLVPPPNVSGLTGFKIFTLNIPQFLELSARTGSDYGLNATAISLYHGASPLHTYRQELWGVPADPSHNLLRLDTSELGYGEDAEPTYFGNLCDANGVHSTTDPSTIVKPCETNFKVFAPHSSNSPLTPFLQNPTSCSTPLSSSLDVLAYDGESTNAESFWPQMTGCDQLSFNPSLYARPTTTSTDTPSGIDVNLSIPQQVSALVPSPTELRATTVTLPPGFSINPNAADGKTSCTEAEARFGSEEEAAVSRLCQGRKSDNRQLSPTRPLARLRLHRSTPYGRKLPDLPGRRRFCLSHQTGGHRHARPRNRPTDDLFPKPPPEPADGLQHAFLWLRTRSAGNSDPVRHLPGQHHIHSLG